MSPVFLLVSSPSVGMPSCQYPSTRFFSRLEAGIVNTFGGGVNIWNASGYLAFDGVAKKLRIDRQAQVRGLSSGPFFKTASDSVFVLDSSAHAIEADVCTTTAASRSTWTFPGGACVGSVARFLPPSALDKWAVATDAFLGYELLDGANVSKWGWAKAGAGGRTSATHTVYIDVSSGSPVLETQSYNLDESYPTSAEVRFGGFETIMGSSIVLGQTSIFKLPLACAWSQPQWNVTSGKPPYDDTAYYCSTKGAKLVKADMHVDQYEYAWYLWPTLPATPPKTAIVDVPHEGGPGPEIVCYNSAE